MPRYDNIPLLKLLAKAPPSNNRGNTGGGGGGGRTPAPAPSPAAGATGREAKRVRNANRDPRYVGNSPLAIMIKQRPIRDAIPRADAPVPVYRASDGAEKPRCLSWHLKGVCMEDCERADDHIPLDQAQVDALHAWCSPAYA